MAYRIEPFVERGELDNRVRGRVTGRLWLTGVPDPIRLDLTGNPHGDLAGRLLRFARTNPGTPGASLAPVQQGDAGDLTASRKCRVLDVPVEEALRMSRSGLRPPEHLANVLYLEWFSAANGRVVIEATDFELTVSEPSWELGPDDASALLRNASEAFDRYIARLSQQLREAEHRGPESLEEWDEFDFERALRESDARADKFRELLEKLGNAPDAEEQIAREMGWTWLLEARRQAEEESEAVPELLEPETASDPEAPDPATEGTDWIRTDDGDISHPLVHRCTEGAIRLAQEFPDEDRPPGDDPDFQQLLAEYQIAAAKLAGALDGLAYGRDTQHPAFTVACLKRALDHLHAAINALAATQEKRLLPTAAGDRLRTEFFELRERILALMQEFRAA